MPKIRRGKEELHVLREHLLTIWITGGGGWGGGCLSLVLSIPMHVIKSLQTFVNSDLFCLGLECFDVIG